MSGKRRYYRTDRPQDAEVAKRLWALGFRFKVPDRRGTLPQHARTRLNRLFRAYLNLGEELRRDPSADEIAEVTGIDAAQVKRPKKPNIPAVSRWEEPTEFGPITYAEENPEYAPAMQRYKRAFETWRALTGKVKHKPRPPWWQQEIGLGVERCPELSVTERQPGELEAAARRWHRRHGTQPAR